MAKRVSSIYGNALFELAVEEKKVDALLSEVQTLQQILLENADLLSLLNHPEVSKIEKLDLLKNIFSGRASDEVLDCGIRALGLGYIAEAVIRIARHIRSDSDIRIRAVLDYQS